MSMLEVNCLEKVYKTRLGGQQVQALRGITFSVEEGEYVALSLIHISEPTRPY